MMGSGAAMSPVLVLQHLADDGPGFLAEWLRSQGLAFEWRSTAAGQGFPASIDGFSALAVLGGEWSANDERPSLRRCEALIQQAVQHGVPVLGHCLGGQLMSRALGGRVGPSPQPERGWHRIDIADSATARAWFGTARSHTVFQWHSEAFSLPDGAELLAGNSACPHQAWALGPHLAMQFHVEVDAAKLALWFDEADAGPWLAGQGAATAHGAGRMRGDTPALLGPSQALAARLYARWIAGAFMRRNAASIL